MDPIFLTWLVSAGLAAMSEEESREAVSRFRRTKLKIDRSHRRSIGDAIPRLEGAKRREIESVLRAAAIPFDSQVTLSKLREVLVLALAYRAATGGLLGGRLSNEQVNDMLAPKAQLERR